MPAPSHFTLGPVARMYGCPTWQVRRLFERGLLPPAARVGPYRVIAVEDLPRVEQALREAGYLKDELKGHGNATALIDAGNLRATVELRISRSLHLA